MEIERSSFPSPWGLSAFWNEINRPVSHLLALTIAEEVAGYMCFWEFAVEIHLMNIAVHPKKRGKGLGRYLLSKMIESGKAKGVETAWLEVRPSNHVATRLYQKVGFREIGRRPRYYSDTNEDGIVMSLSLFQEQENGRGLGKEPQLQLALG